MTKKRFESAFGIHFDFHAMPEDTVPELWKPEYYCEMLDKVKPDYVQCDTKGHAGLSSYPTDAGCRADLKLDILQMMRNETAKRGIALYGHHSGLYDEKAASLHPDWAACAADGTPSREYLSAFGPYADELLLPQLRELAGKYQLNGAWIDGECWAAQADYSIHARSAWRKAYDCEAPLPGTPDYPRYREFCREGFRKYVRHYVEVIKQEFPDFEITSNWIFSAMMPEKMDVKVDFLSGDYAPVNSVESARFQGRILECRNVPWDLMAWGQNAIPFSWKTENRHTKELIQYQQEASVVVAMGGGFEFFNIHYASGGAIQQWAIPIWQKTAEFCRERQVCFNARIVPEFGVLMPCDRNSEDSQFLYTNAPGEKRCEMWISALQDSQFSTRAVMEDQIIDGLSGSWRIIAIPGAEMLSVQAVAELKRFAAAGGIVLVDQPSVRHFVPDELEVIRKQIFVAANGALAGAESFYCTTLPEGTLPGGEVRFDNILDAPALPAYSLLKTGQGVICFLNIDLGDLYTINRSNTLRCFLKQLISLLHYTPQVSVSGSRFADLTVTAKPGKTIINLINMAGEHNVPQVRSYNEVPQIGPLQLKISPALDIRSVEAVPAADFELEKSDGKVTGITLKTLHIHTALVCTAGKED